MVRIALFFCAVISSPFASSTRAAEFTRQGDRVVLLGGTFIERLQAANYVETEWSSIAHSKSLTFRNLGWSGDNIKGESRAVFGDVQAGYERLLRDLKLASPTLTIVHYGNAERLHPTSAEEFSAGLQRLVDDIRATGSRVLLLGIAPRFPVRSGVARDSERDSQRAHLDRTLRTLAAKMEVGYLAIPELNADRQKTATRASRSPFAEALSIDGEQLTSLGYWTMAPQLASQLEESLQPAQIIVDLRKGREGIDAVGATAKLTDNTTLQVSFTLDRLPRVALPGGAVPPSPQNPHVGLRVGALERGHYLLLLDGREYGVYSQGQLAAGISLSLKTDQLQSEELRTAIHKKNELFFHRYRPQNETYLFLFRKHEQGNNAAEVPMFDPLVENMDRLIHRLSVPPPHVITIGRQK